MSYDFRSSQIKTMSIIGSGSFSGKDDLGLIFYSGSRSADSVGGRSDSNMLSNVGNDVWMFVSGTANSGLTRSQGSAVLFGGDVVVSGTLWAERSVIEVDDTVAGDFKAPRKIIAGHLVDASGFPRLLVDPTTPNAGANRDGTVSFNITQGTAAGEYSYPTTINKDVFFHVSGSRGVQGTDDRGVALFEGDVFISGNLLLGPDSVFSTGPTDFLLGTDGTYWLRHSGSGDSGFYGTLQIAGNAIKTAANNTTISFNDAGDVTLAGSLEVDGNQILNSESENTITLDADQRVGIGGITPSYKLDVDGDVRIRGNDIRDNSGNPAISFDGSANTTIKNFLKIDGGEIRDSNSNVVVFLSGSGDATFNKNLTVVGDLMVSGSTVSIGVENLRVEDPVILMGSGSTAFNSDGGIAIASGSSLSAQSLTFGRGGAGALNNLWRAGRKDVQDGDVTSLSDAEPVGIEASQFRIPKVGTPGSTDFFITGSMVSSEHHVTMSNTAGDINVFQAGASIFNLQGGAGLRISDSSGDMTSAFSPYQGGLFFDVHASATEQSFGKNGLITLGGIDNQNGPDLAFGIKAASNSASTVYANKIHSKIGAISETIDKRGLFISGSDHVEIHAHPVNGSPVTRLMLSASSGDLAGGPIIILSSSGEYTGGGASPLRNGFITIGATPAQVDASFKATGLRDVSIFLSGAIGSKNSNTRGVVLASGDMHVSGALTAETFALENLTLTSTAADEPYLRFRDSNVQIRRNAANHLEFADSQSPSSPYTLTQLAALSVTDNTDVFAVTHQDGSSPFLSYVASTGSFSFDHKDTLDGYTARRTNQIGDNVYFFVSGSIGSSYREAPYTIGDGKRGVAVFGGDLHASGSVNWTLHDAYSVDRSGIYAAGNGAVVDTGGSGIPLQIRGAAAGDEKLLALTGSLGFAYSGAGSNAKLHMQTDNAFEFHNSAGEVFRMTAGSSGTNVRFNNNNQVNFQDDSRYLYGLTQDAVKKLSIVNTNSGGTVQVSTNSGRMEVTGSLFPGQDNTYNLGSPDYRWANVYTGDLHLRNERGNWTIYEEPDMLVVVNNLTGKKYKMGLTPLEDEE